jgi:hypothetical protein
MNHSARTIRFIVVVLFSLTTACNTAQSATPARPKPGVTIIAAPTAASSTAAVAPVAAAPTVETAAPTSAAVEQPTSAPTLAAIDAANDVPAGPPAGASPYTGLPVDATVLARKPIFFKVANTVEVRPQSGLGSADVVIEHLSEGNITRFTALYHTNATKRIGSVRSCRLIDLELPVMFDAALVCSGTSPGVKQKMRETYAHKNNLTMISDFGPFECASCPMFRTSDRTAPHNLFGNAANATKELEKRGTNAASTFRSWAFNPQVDPAGKVTTAIDVDYKSGVVGWTYEPGKGVWLRTLSGKAQVDTNTNQQIGASNVLLVYATHVTTLIQEDVTGSKSIEIQVWGQGSVRIFRDGREYGGTWKRNAELGNFEFFDPAGKRIALKPGNTWIQMVPVQGFDVKIATR